MVWYIIAGVAGAAAVALLVANFVRERRYLRRKASEAMGPELRAEIDQEREESMARRELWHKAMEDAKKR